MRRLNAEARDHHKQKKHGKSQLPDPNRPHHVSLNRTVRNRGFLDPSTPTGSLRSQDKTSRGLPHAWVTELCARGLNSRQCLSFPEKNVHITTPRRVLPRTTQRAIPKASSGCKGSLFDCQAERHGNCLGPAEEVARNSGGTSSRSSRTGAVKGCLQVGGFCLLGMHIHPPIHFSMYVCTCIHIYIYIYVCVCVLIHLFTVFAPYLGRVGLSF